MAAIHSTELKNGASYQVLDGFYALVDGVKTRVLPGTGREVGISGLDNGVRWIGDNLSLSDNELITLADEQGNWCDVPPDILLCHSVWDRLDDYSRQRINGGLVASRQAQSGLQRKGVEP